MKRRRFHITLLPERLAVCRLAPNAALPAWATAKPGYSITRTAEELSVVCEERQVPADVRAERGFRILKMEGPFAFTETGIVAAVVMPLARAGIGVFVISTFDTDYIMVKQADLSRACRLLEQRGHKIGATVSAAPGENAALGGLRRR
jgi:hypothetical protein